MSERPEYETEADLTRERAVISLVAAACKVQIAKLPKRYVLDYAVVKGGNVAGFAEVKVRTHGVAEHPTYLLSLAKYQEARFMYGTTGFDTVLLVQFTDCLMTCDLSKVPPGSMRIAMGGRVDRGDWQDQEPCIFIPMDYFKRMEINGDSQSGEG
jgi:hypothetical protein